MHPKHEKRRRRYRYIEYTTRALQRMAPGRRPIARHGGYHNRRTTLPPIIRPRWHSVEVQRCCGGVFRCTYCRKWVGWCEGAIGEPRDPANNWCSSCWWRREQRREKQAA